MNKIQFLERIRKELFVLKDYEINDIISEYEDHIDAAVQRGLTEEDAVKEFGDISELTRGILDAYNIDEDFIKRTQRRNKNNERFENATKNTISFFDKLVSDIGDLIDNLSKDISERYKSNKDFRTLVIIFIALISFTVLNNSIFKIRHFFHYNVFDSLIFICVVFIGAMIFIKMNETSKSDKKVNKEIKSNIVVRTETVNSSQTITEDEPVSSEKDTNKVNDSKDSSTTQIVSDENNDTNDLKDNINNSKSNTRDRNTRNIVDDSARTIIKIFILLFIVIFILPIILFTALTAFGTITAITTLLVVSINTSVNFINIILILVGISIICITTLSLFIKLCKTVVRS